MSNPSFIVSDLDGTLTVDDRSVPYPDKAADPAVVRALALAKAGGYRLVVATARNMRTYNGDVELIRTHTLPVVEDWLKRTGVDHDGVVVGKTWCGPRGFYVDDRNLHVEEFVFRFAGPYRDHGVTVITLAPDASSDDLARLHHRNRRLERWLHVRGYRYLRGHPAAFDLPAVVRDDELAGLADAHDGAEPAADFVLFTDGRDAAGYDPAAFFACHADRLAAGGADELVTVEPGGAPRLALVTRATAARRFPADDGFFPAVAEAATAAGARRVPGVPAWPAG